MHRERGQREEEDRRTEKMTEIERVEGEREGEKCVCEGGGGGGGGAHRQ